MSLKKVGEWGGALAIRLTTEFKELNIQEGDKVSSNIVDGKIIIEKHNPNLNTKEGKFIIKE